MLFTACLLQAGSVRALSPAPAGFGRSVALFNAGRYREAMLGFMDAVVENPRDGRAMEYLKKTGARLLEEEEKTSGLKRQELLLGAEAARDKLEKYKKCRVERIAGWKLQVSRVMELASTPDNMKEAVVGYESLLLSAPVYSDGGRGYSAAAGSIKEVFYKTIKDNYPGLIDGKTTVDVRDLAAAAFINGASADTRGSGAHLRRTQAILDEADRISHLEASLDSLFRGAAEAVRLHSAGKYGEAAPLWKELLKFDDRNEEALLYLELAAGHAEALAAAPPPAAEETGPSAAPAAQDQPVAPKAVKAKKRLKVKKASAPQQAASAGPKPAVLASAGTGEEPSAVLAAPAGGTADELYEKGVREFSGGNYAGAVRYWEECLRLDSQYVKAKLGLERAKREQQE